MRLLIAEDERDLAEALTVFFEKNQFTVDAVNDGAAAYDYARSGVYDAIILDVMMPKMDGVAVLQKLRSEEYTPTGLAFADLTLDSGTGQVACGDKTMRLSGREFQVLEMFMRSPRIVFSADRIMEKIWGWDSEAEINVVWVHISNLRKKLKAIGSRVSISANRGLGYVLEDKGV